ncbi:MAG TPA: DUF6166 domain-containing protein [Pirellulales bacterium]|jgi:hypothetical protein|nr:DUF6166 domain-containing protein [Pirellulales bacterium]
MQKYCTKQYVAESTTDGVEVIIHHSSLPDDTTMLPSFPGGFEWGYEGAGPRSLAYAILAEAVASRFCEEFMRDVISKKSLIANQEPAVVFHEADVLSWLKNELNRRNWTRSDVKTSE